MTEESVAKLPPELQDLVRKHAAEIAAAGAAMQYVARALGLTGFQMSCAELDVLRRVRGLEWGCVQNFEELLYPQYEHRFKGWAALLAEHRVELAKRAAAKLAESPDANAAVRRHWKKLVKGGGSGG